MTKQLANYLLAGFLIAFGVHVFIPTVAIFSYVVAALAIAAGVGLLIGK